MVACRIQRVQFQNQEFNIYQELFGRVVERSERYWKYAERRHCCPRQFLYRDVFYKVGRVAAK